MWVKVALVLFVSCLSSVAQGFGRREAMRPWLQGRFPEAEREFALREAQLPRSGWLLLCEAEFEIERARYGRAAALVKRARDFMTADTEGSAERRLARVMLSVGRFSEAWHLALEGRRWDGKDVQTLKGMYPMDLVTIGEVCLARGEFSKAIAVLESGRDRAKKVSSLYGVEWVRAQDDIAVADLSLGRAQAASQAATLALSAAESEWGLRSIPAMDALDTLGLVQLSESRFRDAETSLSQSRVWREALYGTQHPKVAASYLHASLLSAGQMDSDGALRLMRRGLEIEKSLAVSGPNGRWALAVLSGAELFSQTGQIDSARDCYENAVPVLERELGPDAPRLKDARQRAAGLGAN